MVRHDPDLSAEHQGKVYYFCMKRDLEAFEKDPDKYLEVEGQPHQHPDPGVAG
jgi:YHS domain-containing protein